MGNHKIDLRNRKYGKAKRAILPRRGIKVWAHTQEECQKKIDNLLRFCEANKIEFPDMFTDTDFDLSEFNK